MKKKIPIIAFLTFLITVTVLALFNPQTIYGDSSIRYQSSTINQCSSDKCFDVNEHFTKTFSITEKAEYNLIIDYVSSNNLVLDDLVNIKFLNYDEEIILDKQYYYEGEEYGTDRYGNEVIGSQKIYHEPLSENINSKYEVESFTLQPGQYVVDITPKINSIEILDANLIVVDNSNTANLQLNSDLGEQEPIKIEGENFFYKNDLATSVQYLPENNVTPINSTNNVMNVIDGNSFSLDGQNITYQVDIEHAGFYDLSLRSMNEIGNGMTQNISLFVNEEIQNEELENISLPATKEFENQKIDQPIYLAEGLNTITIELSMDKYNNILQMLEELQTDISDLKIEMIKVTGGVEDSNRSWQLSQYIPTLDDDLKEIESLIFEIESEMTTEFSGTDNELVNKVDLMKSNIDLIQSDSDNLPNYNNYFYVGTTSIDGLATQMEMSLKNGNLSIDSLYLVPTEQQLITYEPNFANDLFFSVKRLFSSFSNLEENSVTDYNQEIEVWVKRPRQYVDVMQKYVDEEFTPNTGIKVNFSIVTDQNKITMSNASGITPDLAMSLDTWYIYQLALRGALYDFTTDMDSTSEITQEMIPGGMTQLVIDDRLYGIPETQDVFVTYYRTDIFDQYGYAVPENWSESIQLLEDLQINGMNYYLPLSGGTSLKTLPSTGPFFMQNDASIYSADGLTVDLTGEKQQQSLEFMTDLYNIYGMEISEPNFYDSFREGTSPIGISNFSTYIQLTYAAPEISDDWAIAPVPGVVGDNGEINRSMPGGNGAQASVIFNKSEMINESLEFLRWWNSTDVQVEYTQRLVSTYGAEYMWNSSNISAFNSLQIPKEDLAVFNEQFNWVYDVPITPANYYVERGISDTWNQSIFEGESVRVVAEEQEKIINSELENRYIEFGYMNEEGEAIKPYYIPKAEDIEKEIQDE